MQGYAVIKTGGKQYTVKPGDVLSVELLKDAKEGDTVELAAMAAHDGNELVVGTPELANTVKATVLGAERAKKIIIFKKMKRSTYRRKNGHRQHHHKIRIESIPAN